MNRIALLGGTGPEGRGLAVRFAAAGLEVIIGSRDRERAAATVAELATRGSAGITAASNEAAAARAEIICPVVPFTALPAMFAGIADAVVDKVVLDVTNPVIRQHGEFLLQPVAGGSTGEWIQELAPRSRVVSGFKNHSAEELSAVDRALDGDVLFCSDHADLTPFFVALANRIPRLRGVDAGPLRRARSLESLTALLLNLNHRYRALTSLRIVGLRD